MPLPIANLLRFYGVVAESGNGREGCSVAFRADKSSRDDMTEYRHWVVELSVDGKTIKLSSSDARKMAQGLIDAADLVDEGRRLESSEPPAASPDPAPLPTATHPPGLASPS